MVKEQEVSLKISVVIGLLTIAFTVGCSYMMLKAQADNIECNYAKQVDVASIQGQINVLNANICQLTKSVDRLVDRRIYAK